MEIVNDIKPRGTNSAYIVASFDKGLSALEKQGYKLISAEENAELRMQEGKDADVSKNGNWIREGVLYVPGRGKFITKNSAVLDNPKKATQTHRNGSEYFVTNAQMQKALKSSVQVPYDVSKIPTNRFGEDITAFVFGKNAQDYGLFLKDAGISAMPLWFDSENYVTEQGKPYANQLWLDGFGYGSELGGGSRLLSYVVRSRGVK